MVYYMVDMYDRFSFGSSNTKTPSPRICGSSHRETNLETDIKHITGYPAGICANGIVISV